MKISRVILTFFFYWIAISIGNSQTISSIRFEGLKKNKEETLRQFLQIKEGDIWDEDKVKSELDLLYSNGYFETLEYEVSQIENNTELTIVAKEKITIIPELGLGGVTDDHAFWLSAGIADYNFSGLHDLAKLNYRWYGGHSLEAYYSIPRGRNKWMGLDVYGALLNSEEPLIIDDETFGNYFVRKFHTNFLYRINLDREKYFKVGGGYLLERYALNEDGEILGEGHPLQVISRKRVYKLLYNQSRIRYEFTQLYGYALESLIEFAHAPEDSGFDDDWFWKFEMKAKYYRLIGRKWNYAASAFYGMSTNNGSPFAAFVEDNYLNARGAGDRSKRGHAQVVTNHEVRYLLTEVSAYSVQLAFFVDGIATASPGTKRTDLFANQNLNFFAGPGIRLHLNKFFRSTLRLDYGLNLSNLTEHGLILGVGQFI